MKSISKRKARTVNGWAMVSIKTSDVTMLYIGNKKESMEYFEEQACELMFDLLLAHELKRVKITIEG